MNIIFISVMKFHYLLILIYDLFLFFLFKIYLNKLNIIIAGKMDIEEENDKSIEKPCVFLKF